MLPALAQDRFSTEQDPLAIVSRAPGLPEGSIFSTFAENESVSLINGNLSIAHASSAVFPLDGGGSLSLSRAYNSKSISRDVIAWEYCPTIPVGSYGWQEVRYFVGRSWAGAGWTMNFGRVMRRPIFAFGVYTGERKYFVDALGTEIQFEPYAMEASMKIDVEAFETCVPDEEGYAYACCPGDEHECCGDPNPGGPCTGYDQSGVVEEYLLVKQPDGTTYRLEQLVSEVLLDGDCREEPITDETWHEIPGTGD